MPSGTKREKQHFNAYINNTEKQHLTFYDMVVFSANVTYEKAYVTFFGLMLQSPYSLIHLTLA